MSAEIADVEKELRRRIREEVRASPAMWREFLARRESWVFKALRIGYLAMLLLGGVMMPFSLSAVFIGMSRIVGAQGPFAGRGNSDFTAFGAGAAFFCGYGLLIGMTSVRRRLIESPQLAVGVHFPVSDATLFRNACREVIVDGLFCAYMVAFLFAYFAWQHDSSFGEWLITLFAILLYVPIIWALVILFCVPGPRDKLESNSARPGKMAGTIMFVLSLGGISLGMAGIFLEPVVSLVGAAALILTPTGWVNGIVCLAVIERNPIGWLFLVPIVLLNGLGMRRYRRGITIHEVMVRSDGSLRAVYQRQWSEVVGEFATSDRRESRTAVGVSAVVPISVESIREALLSPLSKQSQIFNGVRKWRTTFREKTVLVAVRAPSGITVGKWARWAIGMTILSWAFIGAVRLWVPPVQQQKEQDQKLVFALSSGALALLFCRGVPVPSRSDRAKRQMVHDRRSSAGRDRRSRPIDPYFPIGFGEITNAIAKSSLFTLLCWLPISIAIAAAGVALAEIPLIDAVAAAICPAGLVVSVLGLVVCLMLGHATNDTRRRIVLATWGAAGSVALFSGLALFTLPLGIWTIVTLLISAASSWGFWRYYRRLYEWGKVDIIR